MTGQRRDIRGREKKNLDRGGTISEILKNPSDRKPEGETLKSAEKSF